MDPSRLIRLDGTLNGVTPGEVDDYNVPTPVITSVPVKCWLEQSRASEDTSNTDQQAETYDLYLDPDSEPSGYDSLTVLGVTYQFDGPPWPAVNPRTQQRTHWEAKGVHVQ